MEKRSSTEAELDTTPPPPSHRAQTAAITLPYNEASATLQTLRMDPTSMLCPRQYYIVADILELVRTRVEPCMTATALGVRHTSSIGRRFEVVAQQALLDPRRSTVDGMGPVSRLEAITWEYGDHYLDGMTLTGCSTGNAVFLPLRDNRFQCYRFDSDRRCLPMHDDTDDCRILNCPPGQRTRVDDLLASWIIGDAPGGLCATMLGTSAPYKQVVLRSYDTNVEPMLYIVDIDTLETRSSIKAIHDHHSPFLVSSPSGQTLYAWSRYWVQLDAAEDNWHPRNMLCRYDVVTGKASTCTNSMAWVEPASVPLMTDENTIMCFGTFNYHVLDVRIGAVDKAKLAPRPGCQVMEHAAIDLDGNVVMLVFWDKAPYFRVFDIRANSLHPDMPFPIDKEEMMFYGGYLALANV